MPLDQVAVTPFSMTALLHRPASGRLRHEERMLGRDMSIEGLVLPDTAIAWVEEINALTILSELENLPENWDGYGALQIHPDTITNSKDVLPKLLRFAPGPDIFPNPNGTISFEWASEHGSAHLEIGKTRFSFLVKPAGGAALPLEGAAKEVPTELGQLIQAIVFPSVRPVATITKPRYTAGDERASR